MSVNSLPDAREHPLFYVGIYAAIGMGSAFIGVASSATQYTGALRASRILFKYVCLQVLVGIRGLGLMQIFLPGSCW